MCIYKPRFYRGEITQEEFDALMDVCPRTIDRIRDIMQMYFVDGTRLTKLPDTSKQAATRRVKYYIEKGIKLGVFPVISAKKQSDLFSN